MLSRQLEFIDIGKSIGQRNQFDSGQDIDVI